MMAPVAGTVQINVVVFCVDQNFFLPCAFLVEQLARDPERDRYDIAIVHDGLSEVQLARLSERAGKPIVALPVRTDGTQTERRAPDEPALAATYFRLLMHRLLPAQYSRILYLDVDIVIERLEIASLFDLDLGAAAFAAVRAKHYIGLLCPELAPFDRDGTVAYLVGIGLDLGDPYLNAGVILIDRARWTALEIPGRALAFAQRYGERCRHGDQSAINAVGAGHWAELSPRWNYPSTLRSTEIDEAIRPVIRHYTGAYKPWNAAAWDASVSGRYGKWLEASGWPGRFPAGPTIDTPAARSARLRRGWLRRLVSGGEGARHAADDLRRARESGRQQRAGLVHALTAILTFSRFVDMDPEQRRALVKAVIATVDMPRKSLSTAAAGPGGRS